MTESIKGKKVFVTGADGFIGSHLVERLVEMGAKVRAMVYYNSWNQKGWLRDIPRATLNKVDLFPGDIRDAERVRQGVQSCEYIFHLSSLIAIPYSYEAPRSYVDTNVSGALNVLQACRESKCLIRLVHVSTSEVYGTAQTIPISEDHPLVGQSPYSASKIAADKLAESYHLSFGLPVVIARPFNTYGPRQTARAVIPTIISQLLAKRKVLKLGALSPTRDFNFVTDTAAGMLALGLSKKAEGQVVNIGSGEEWSIAQTVSLLSEIVGREVKIVLDKVRIRPENSEVSRLLADTSKITRLTGWQSQVKFKEGLRHTVDWITKNVDLYDVDQYSK
ncbi:MAG: SDR family NAD(P)-dependent oxidoreductase [Proteobacteria bacterium]|nr:SDR family NAD(P)-dependent oxidoreductase [Pseudomonadota bacterium]NBS06001.1 SDR family NAD(P)-dependent oxidoreductase [Verrucomicrobiota bacterium]NBS49128.1 SDR family NAD(P)-dependent oxidoreductase [Verrucomicrobiota bacterium]NBS78441.1 SDR family NAD(P)-dependent oxidoreductase [bacterium]